MMPGSRTMHRLAVSLGIVVACAMACPGATAQGYPGGGGGRGGRGMHAPRSDTKSPNAAARSAPDPLAAFFTSLHALRMELLVREDQAASWTTMQDALRAYVELSPANAVELPDTPTDPLTRLHGLADDARARADALQKVSDSVTGLVGALDDHQRQVFASRLADAFAGGSEHAP